MSNDFQLDLYVWDTHFLSVDDAVIFCLWVTGYGDVYISTVNQNFPETQLGDGNLINIKSFQVALM